MRRFASSAQVGGTWQSVSEQIFDASRSVRKRYKLLSIAALPAPFFGVLCPGGIEFKASARARFTRLSSAAGVALCTVVWAACRMQNGVAVFLAPLPPGDHRRSRRRDAVRVLYQGTAASRVVIGCHMVS